MPRAASLTLLLFASMLSAGEFAWKDIAGAMVLTEDGKPALAYKHAQTLAPGAPEDRRRCCYLFPVMTPAGVSPLDDFPKDHYHHRGLFWSWPVVEAEGQRYDIWLVKGIAARAMGPVSTRLANGRASLEVTNGWFAGERQLVKEQVRVEVLPVAGSTRTLRVELQFEALGVPVTLRGSQEKGKSYGGFSARFAPREDTVLRADGERLQRDEDLIPHKWAELEAVYKGQRAVVRITPDASNPLAPYQWCLRAYGFVGASFPGRTETVQGYTLEPGKPLRLAFTVTLTDLE